MERNGKAALVALLMVGGAFGTLSADDSTHTVFVDTYTVSAHTHTDEFTGTRVIITELKDPKGTPVGGASVKINHGEETSITVFTPSGILIRVNGEGKIEQPPAEMEPIAK